MAALRGLTNSLLAGLLLAPFLSQAILILNPQVPLTVPTVARVSGVLALTYGVAGGLGFWLLLKVVEAMRGGPLRPAWFSFRILTWLFLLDLVAGAALLWHNLFVYRQYLQPEAIRALALSATTLSAAAATLLVLGLFHYSFGRHWPRASYTLSLATLSASLVLPFYFRPYVPERPRPAPRLPLEDRPSPRRVTLIGIEGASMAYVLPAVAEGRLPHFARLIERGASGSLKTLHPTESFAIWTSTATGKLPRQHRLTGFHRYRFPGVAPLFALMPRGPYLYSLERLGLVRRVAMTSNLRRSRAFWNILSSFGVKLGLVRWWGTYPAEEVNGFVISDLFHRQLRGRFNPPLPNLTYPPELFEQLQQFVVSPEQVDPGLVSRFVDAAVSIPGDKLDWEFELKQRALADDATYQRVGRTLKDIYDPQVYAIYFFGLDVVGHSFLRYQSPENFGDVSDKEIRRYGRVVDAYYQHMDAVVGEYLQSMRPDEILAVISGHGMEPLPLVRRVVEAFKGNSYLSGYHDEAPDGLAIFYGPGIASGAKIQGASVLDITPTLLYLMGLPLGQDMEGTLLTGVLEESLAKNQPVTFISSYQNFLIEPSPQEAFADFSPLLDLVPALLDERE